MENRTQKLGLRVVAGFLVAILIIVGVSASGITLPGLESNPNLGNDMGRLTVLLIDAPVELEALVITITNLEVHLVGDGEPDGEWIDLMPKEGENDPDPIGPFDLLELQRENTLTLFDGLLVEGTYNKIRMYVDSAKAYYDDAVGIDLSVPPGKIDVITKFHISSVNDGDEVVTVVTIDMEPDFAAVNKNNFRPTLKATIEFEIEQIETTTTEP